MIFALLLLAFVQSDAHATLDRWREDLALDAPKSVLEDGEKLVAPGGALEHDGDALALVARARFAARPDGFASAWSLLEHATPTPQSTPSVELEKVRLLVESDELSRALMAILPSPDAQEPRFAGRAESWLYAGRAWTRSGQPERAIPFLQRFVELAPHDADTPSALHALAQTTLAHGDAATAQKLVARAEEVARWHALWRARATQVRDHPDEPLPRIGLAQLWLQIGEHERAKAVLNELVTRKPDVAAAWFYLGEAERGLDAMETAASDYGKCLELDPGHLLARNNRATIHRLAGRLAEARADFETIVDGPHANEKNALGAHYWLAWVLEQQGEHETATKRYARFVELGGKDPAPTKQQ